MRIAGTIADGEQIADFRVIHIPGHAPGQIALFRRSDRLLIAADASTLWMSKPASKRSRPASLQQLEYRNRARVDPSSDPAAS